MKLNNDIVIAAARILSRIVRKTADCFFPPRCPVCDELLEPDDEGIHRNCRKELYPVGDRVCICCGRPVPDDRDEYCSECCKILKNGPRPFCQAKALFEYRGAVKITMYRLKYSNRREYVRYFAELAALRYGEWIRSCQVDCLIPVPMYPAKKRQRGYNQAEIFARELGSSVQLPVNTAIIRRVKNTRPLKSMNGMQRRKTVAGAFQVNEAELRKTGCRTVLLIDDIYTTGATVSEMAACLRGAGVRKIYVLTICTAG